MKKDTYIDTGTPGIKQNVITKKYVVSLDFGRQLRMNKKTGRMEMKQIKTTRTVSTMKEAKAIQGKNNALKKTRRTTGITRKIAFDQVLDEYTEYYKSTWSDSYMMQKQSQAKRMKAYFSDRDVRTIDTLDIEKFFAWCKESQPGFEYPLSNNSVQKIRTHLKDFWRYMKKNQNRYGITENVVLDADYGEVQVFKGNILNAEQVNYMLQFAINYEADYSVWSMIGYTDVGKARMEMKVGLTFACMNLKKLAKIKARWGLLETRKLHKNTILDAIRLIKEIWLWDLYPRAALSTV